MCCNITILGNTRKECISKIVDEIILASVETSVKHKEEAKFNGLMISGKKTLETKASEDFKSDEIANKEVKLVQEDYKSNGSIKDSLSSNSQSSSFAKKVSIFERSNSLCSNPFFKTVSSQQSQIRDIVPSNDNIAAIEEDECRKQRVQLSNSYTDFEASFLRNALKTLNSAEVTEEIPKRNFGFSLRKSTKITRMAKEMEKKILGKSMELNTPSCQEEDSYPEMLKDKAIYTGKKKKISRQGLSIV